MRAFLILPVLFCHLIGYSQQDVVKNSRSGMFSLGGRSTFSFFNDGSWRNNGTGIGGQFRLQLNDRVNTEWFFDYISGSVGDQVNRTDYHIGWSVLFYLLKPKEEKPAFLQPYILAGHCFDYSYLEENANRSNHTNRWSSAVQAGTGMHANITPRFDLSLNFQYMMHLGNHIHVHEQQGAIEFHQEEGFNLEGHVLTTISVNYKIADLW